MAILNKDAILTADDLPTEDVEVPEWGGTVRLRALTGAERDEFELSQIKTRSDGSLETALKNVRASFLARCIVDENGNRLFSDKEIDKLGSKSAKVLDRLFEKAQRLSGLTDQDAEELAENLGGTNGGRSRSV